MDIDNHTTKHTRSPTSDGDHPWVVSELYSRYTFAHFSQLPESSNSPVDPIVNQTSSELINSDALQVVEGSHGPGVPSINSSNMLDGALDGGSLSNPHLAEIHKNIFSDNPQPDSLSEQTKQAFEQEHAHPLNSNTTSDHSLVYDPCHYLPIPSFEKNGWFNSANAASKEASEIADFKYQAHLLDIEIQINSLKNSLLIHTKATMGDIIDAYHVAEQSLYQLEWQHAPLLNVLAERFITNIVRDIRYVVSFFTSKDAGQRNRSVMKNQRLQQLHTKLSDIGRAIEKRVKALQEKATSSSWYTQMKFHLIQVLYFFVDFITFGSDSGIITGIATLLFSPPRLIIATLMLVGTGILVAACSPYILSSGVLSNCFFSVLYLAHICQMIWLFATLTAPDEVFISHPGGFSSEYCAPFIRSFKNLIAKHKFDWVKFTRIFLILFLANVYFIMSPLSQRHGFPLMISWQSWLIYSAFSFVFYLLQTLAEEIEFRSLLQYCESGTSHKWLSMLLSSVVFGYVHLGNFSLGCPADVWDYAYYLGHFTSCGISYGLITMMTMGLEVSWALHFAHNYFIDVILGKDHYCGIFSVLFFRHPGLQSSSSDNTHCLRPLDIPSTIALSSVVTVVHLCREAVTLAPVWFAELFFRPIYKLKTLDLPGLSSLEFAKAKDRKNAQQQATSSPRRETTFQWVGRLLTC